MRIKYTTSPDSLLKRSLSLPEGTNVEEAANFLVKKIIDNEKWRSHQQRNGHDARDGAFALPHVAARGAEGGPRRLLLTREDEEGTRRKADCAC